MYFGFKKQMSDSQIKSIFFNTNLTTLELRDYIDLNLIVETDTPLFPVEIKTLTKGDIEKNYNVQEISPYSKKEVLDILADFGAFENSMEPKLHTLMISKKNETPFNDEQKQNFKKLLYFLCL